jgi:hypothetical protein
VKCPKCSYTSYDYLKECKKCGEILVESRRSLNLKMVEPTLFTSIYSDEPEKTNLTKVEPTFTGTSKPVDEQHENGFILDNEFAPQEKAEFDPAPEISSEQKDLSDLGKLGSMDSIEPRSMPEPGAFNNTAEIDLEEPKIDTLDDLEFTSSFADKEAATIEGTGTIELEGLEIDDLDLFTDLADTSETTPIVDQNKDDSPFELNINSEIKEPVNYDLDKVEAADDGTIELELDMDDDKSLDDLLADLDKKES